ncbi:MAG: hypothetical protein FD181_1987 [Prolixibacteraceae bacterium]|nr:MAG: hypothetical protein FD181_1987 [Prolixibacteraceae bacterium]
MKTKNLIQATGAIIKEESIVPITTNIMEHTCVAEANLPYSNYYGVAPFNMPTKPNSLYLFTEHYYTLEEALRYGQLIDLSCRQVLNVAASVLEFKDGQYPAIRIKNFPDYKMIHQLQECFFEQGVRFAKKVHIGNTAIIRTNKCFSLEKIDENIYIDHQQEKTAYIALPKLIKNDKYLEVITDIRNNTSFAMFDSARAAMFLDSNITDFIRIYSGQLDINLLKSIQKRFEMAM